MQSSIRRAERKYLYLLVAVILILPLTAAQPEVLDAPLSARLGSGWHSLHQNPENGRTYRWLGREGTVVFNNTQATQRTKLYFYVKSDEQPHKLRIIHHNTTIYQRTIYPFWEGHRLRLNLSQGRNELTFYQQGVCPTCKTLLFENVTLTSIRNQGSDSNFFSRLDSLLFAHGIAQVSFYASLFLVIILASYLLITNLNKRIWTICLLLILVATLARFVYPPMHLMYTDEHLNMEAASHHLQSGLPTVCTYKGGFKSCRLYQKPVAYSLSLALVFAIFEASSIVAISFSVLLGSLLPLFIFLTLYNFTGARKLSFIAAFVSAMLPSQIIWSNTAETNIPTLLFFSIFLFALSLYHKERDYIRFAFLTLATLLAMQFRPEMALITPLTLLIYYLVFKNDVRSRLRRKSKLLAALPSLILVVPCLSHLAANVSYYRSFLVFQQIKAEWLQLVQFTSFKLAVLPLALLVVFCGSYYLWRIDSKFTKFYIAVTSLFLITEPFLVKTLARSSIYPLFFLSLFPASALDAFLRSNYLSNLRRKLPSFGLSLRQFRLCLLAGILVLTCFGGIYLAGERRSDSSAQQARLQTIVPELMEKDVKNCTIVLEHPVLVKATTDLSTVSSQYLLSHTDLLATDNCYLLYTDIGCHLKLSRYWQHRCQALNKTLAGEKYIEYNLGNSYQRLYRLKLPYVS